MAFYMNGADSYVPGRNRVIDDIMRAWQERYCTYAEVNVCVSTFNVNGQQAPRNVMGWFPRDKKADFYIVGLQEIDQSFGAHIIDNVKKEIDWIECIRNSLPNPNDYIKIRSHRLVGILIVMFKLMKCNVHVSEVKSSMLATGISVMGAKLGNKGGTGISLKLNDSRICFINCHLAAGNGELKRRNQDFRDLTNLTFDWYASIWSHDAIFWFGDLNYRLADELNGEKKRGQVFTGFEETPPAFRPTYKYDVGTCKWDSSEKDRAPAWCDRILWRKLEPYTQITQTSYDSLEAVVLSDHKPVIAYFRLRLRTIDQQKMDESYKDALWEAY